MDASQLVAVDVTQSQFGDARALPPAMSAAEDVSINNSLDASVEQVNGGVDDFFDDDFDSILFLERFAK